MGHRHYHHCFAGPIAGLSLPVNAWEALQREGITTLDQLRAIANQIHWLPGIGPKTARVIRDELARVSSSNEKPSGEGHTRHS
jgi:hypothetical protein